MALSRYLRVSLANNGSIGTSLNALNARDQSIAIRQAAQQKMFDASQQTVEQSTTRLSSSLAAIGNYNRIFSM